MVGRRQARKARLVWIKLHDCHLYVSVCSTIRHALFNFPPLIYVSCNSVITEAALSGVVLRRTVQYSHHNPAATSEYRQELDTSFNSLLQVAQAA